MARWLLTGGAGYIGSHVLRELAASGREVVVVDDLSTGIASRVPDGVPLVEMNLSDSNLVTVMRDYQISGVVHLAAKKAVGESVERPLLLSGRLWGARERRGWRGRADCSHIAVR